MIKYIPKVMHLDYVDFRGVELNLKECLAPYLRVKLQGHKSYSHQLPNIDIKKHSAVEIITTDSSVLVRPALTTTAKAYRQSIMQCSGPNAQDEAIKILDSIAESTADGRLEMLLQVLGHSGNLEFKRRENSDPVIFEVVEINYKNDKTNASVMDFSNSMDWSYFFRKSITILMDDIKNGASIGMKIRSAFFLLESRWLSSSSDQLKLIKILVGVCSDPLFFCHYSWNFRWKTLMRNKISQIQDQCREIFSEKFWKDFKSLFEQFEVTAWDEK